MPTAKKLIEVALPVKEISAESVRDKSIRHGHISTLHLWWARRPLPVCRAVVFASLVPDPLDPHCPEVFQQAVALLLGKDEKTKQDPYRPYDDIPWTPPVDPMEDNLRNRLQMFIGKFSDRYCADVKAGKVTPAKDMLDAASLIKWDNKNNETTLNKARKLIWVAHNSNTGQEVHALLNDFDQHYTAIKAAEQHLYALPDRHLPAPEVQAAEAALHQAIEAFLDRMPKVFDPFAGGGAIPLEAARLGCRAYGNDINPVAHIIQKGSLEFPQKFGKPITYSLAAFTARYGTDALEQQRALGNVFGDAVLIANRLSFDVEYYAKKMLAAAEAEIGHFYPADEKGNKPIAYYWARVGTCSNPSCRAEVPLLKGFYLAKRRSASESDYIYLNPIISENRIEFEIRKGICIKDGFVQNRKSLVCPCCGNVTSNAELKAQFFAGTYKERLLAVIDETNNGKIYRLPVDKEINAILEIPKASIEINEPIAKENTKQFDLCGWGFLTFGNMFSPRQLLVLKSLLDQFFEIKIQIDSPNNEFDSAIVTYLGILVDRIVARNNTFCVWHILQETVEHPFGRQAIPMVFDFPEMNPFGSLSGAAMGQLPHILDVIESESHFSACICNNASSGDKSQFPDKSINAVITDPPYYDAIAYADLSDFFYVWLKRTLGDTYPLNFATPQTPKSEECTALKHHHYGKTDIAKLHFETKLLEIFDAIEHQTSDIVSVMFAHQSTVAWTTLCNSILNARMNLVGSWAIDTEVTGALKSEKAFLSSSITVAARPAQRHGYGDYKLVQKAIESRVSEEVEMLYALGFRGADLLTACFGQAVSEFGRYKKVEKADGSEVTVAELLELSRESAFNALLKGFAGDDYTKFYIGWLQLYGFQESDFDDAAKFSRVGLTVDVQALFGAHILLKNGNKQTLGNYLERIEADKRLGEATDSHLIDHVHRAMYLYQGSDRGALLQFIAKAGAEPGNAFWRVIVALCEVLPAGSDDQKQALGLMTNKDSLIRESKNPAARPGEQPTLF